MKEMLKKNKIFKKIKKKMLKKTKIFKKSKKKLTNFINLTQKFPLHTITCIITFTVTV
jgi:hypothetical protein